MPRKKIVDQVDGPDGMDEEEDLVTIPAPANEPAKRVKQASQHGLGVFVRSSLTIMPDGRVEARVTSPDDPSDEVIYRTSQHKAAAWIANDVGRRIQIDADKIKPFRGE